MQAMTLKFPDKSSANLGRWARASVVVIASHSVQINPLISIAALVQSNFLYPGQHHKNFIPLSLHASSPSSIP
jgi:hypothetical protein